MRKRAGIIVTAVVAALAATLAATVHAEESQQVGELAQPGIITKGKFVIVAPPTGIEAGKPIVRVSAPQSDWKPYLVNGAALVSERASDCTLALAYARQYAADERLHAYEASILAKPSSPNKKLLDRRSVQADIKSVVLKNARCEESDGSDRFFVQPTAQPDLDAPYER